MYQNFKVKAMKGNSLRTEAPTIVEGKKLFTFTFHSESISAIDLMCDRSPGNSPPSVSLSSWPRIIASSFLF